MDPGGGISATSFARIVKKNGYYNSMSKNENGHTTGWQSRATIAAVFGASIETVDGRWRKKLPPDAEQKDGRRVLIHGPSVLALLLQQQRNKGGGASAAEGDSDGEREALTKQKLKAEIEKLQEQIAALRSERDRTERTVVPLHEVRETFKIFSQLMRDCGRRAERLFGLDGKELVDSLLDSMGLNYRRLAGQEDPEIVFCIEKDGKLVRGDMDV